MARENLKLTVEIIMSHVSTTELSTQELVDEIKTIYNLLASLEGGEVIPESIAPGKEEVKKPPIPLKDIVTAKHVVCLECGKKLRTLKTHLRKAHNLTAKEYYKMFDLDKKKYPLVAKEYSEQRRKIAVERGLGAKGGRKKKV